MGADGSQLGLWGGRGMSFTRIFQFILNCFLYEYFLARDNQLVSVSAAISKIDFFCTKIVKYY